jgi:hypothetical protein
MNEYLPGLAAVKVRLRPVTSRDRISSSSFRFEVCDVCLPLFARHANERLCRVTEMFVFSIDDNEGDPQSALDCFLD